MKDDAGTANPVYRPDNLAIIEGTSQSGRMIRSFLALGFNRDEAGKRVFDGAYPHIGGGLMPLNVRFGQPVRAWGEQTDHVYPAYDFPFSYARQTDPLTLRTQGILDRCSATDTCPRIFHVATSLEMWEGRQSLGLTDPLGEHDVPDPAKCAHLHHGEHAARAGRLAARDAGAFRQLPAAAEPEPAIMDDARLDERAHRMGARRRDPAGKRRAAHRRRARSFRPTRCASRRSRPIAMAASSARRPRPRASTTRCMCSISARSTGRRIRAASSRASPRSCSSASYGVLEMQVDADGNDIAGVESVFSQVPIGTYTGWNLGRKDRFENGMCNLQGSFIPFAATRAERLAVGDPRLSIEERYPTKESYLAAFKKAADGLVAGRYLLPDDAKLLVERAEKEGIRTGP